MAMLTLDAASETTIKKALPFRHTSNLRDASFSSYLDGAEEGFTHKLAESSKNGKSLISSAPFEHIHLVSKKSEDNEIDIFSADKYFNEGVDDDLSPRIASNSSAAKFNQKMVPPPKLDPPKQHTRSATPSVRSESSWNSQNALLHNNPRNQQPQKTNKVNYRRSFLANFGCNCSCGDKNSVDIDVPNGETSPNRSLSVRTAPDKPKRPSTAVDLVSLSESQSNASWIREDIRGIKLDQLKIGLSTEEHFRFPVFDSNAKTGDHVLEMQRKKEEDDTTRKSMEVFGSPIQRNGKKSLNMLTWDAIVPPKVGTNEISENSRGLYNDADSDASSDLFEIESFATNPSQYLTRQASDGMSSAFTQTCYAPSEASIEWSVVTASAADFSVMSDIEEMRPTNTKANNRGMSQNDQRSLSDREMPKRRSGILSGCYSQKAVNVAGDVYRTSEKVSPGRHEKPEFLMPMTRFHADNEPARFDKRNGHFSYDTRLLYKH